MTANSDYASKDGQYFAHARTEIIPLLPEKFRTIIDVGGATGATLSAIKSRFPDAQTTCIDLHGPSIEIAAQRGHDARQCDLEQGIPEIFATCDVAMFLDVLEHLSDPWRLLQQVVQRLPDGATVIVSLPNVRYWQVSWNLFFLGRWTLQDAGVLDRTHLRFFTRASGGELVGGAGLTVRSVTGKLAGGRRNRLLNTVTLGLFADFLRSQYIYVATK